MIQPGALLLDVNVLVALFHPEHVHHDVAHDWFADHRREGWATCPITENGFIRVVLNQAAEARLRPAQVLEQLRAFCSSGGHDFWQDSVSLRDSSVFDPAFVAGPRQLTDVYLLGLARKMSGRLATFDRAIPVKAIVGGGDGVVEIVGTGPDE
jgi:uncharacterized protein